MLFFFAAVVLYVAKLCRRVQGSFAHFPTSMRVDEALSPRYIEPNSALQGAESGAGSFPFLTPTAQLRSFREGFVVACPSKDVDLEASLPGRHLFLHLDRALA